MDSSADRRPLSLQSGLAADRHLRASGCRYKVGHDHGSKFRNEIHRFLGDGLTRIGPILGRPVTLSQFADTISSYAAAIEGALPDLAEELCGLADGAGITMEAAYFLQLRRELTGYRMVRPQGDCTVFGRMIHGLSVLGQTIDLSGDMAPEMTTLQIELADSNRSLLLVSYTGLLGYIGMNDRGLAICLSLVLGGSWRPGIPGYLLVRHLLDEASTVNDCLERMSELPISSSRSMIISDGSRLVTVEYILDEMAVLEGEELLHANHFLHSGFVNRDELNPFARTSSLRRYRACAAALQKTPPCADMRSYLGIFDSPPVHVARGDIKRECTVASVVMSPERGKMLVSQCRCTNPESQRAPDSEKESLDAYDKAGSNAK